MVKTKITSFRGWEKKRNPIDAERELIEAENIRLYGKPDVPGVVKIAVQAHAEAKRSDLKTALKALIAEAGSYETLKTRLTKKATQLRQKRKQQRSLAKAVKGKSPGVTIYEHSVVVEGGAPGLGGANKTLKIPTRRDG